MQEKAKPDFNVLFYAVINIIYSFGIVFIMCECGQQLSNAFEVLCDEIYENDWHLFPTNLQRTWHIVLVTAQQPVEIVSFGNIVCYRETFKRVNQN